MWFGTCNSNIRRKTVQSGRRRLKSLPCGGGSHPTLAYTGDLGVFDQNCGDQASMYSCQTTALRCQCTEQLKFMETHEQTCSP